ncbi:hypothetical protein LINGRAHAP2_LOCUS4295, partial [Linum grandiflorum]
MYIFRLSSCLVKNELQLSISHLGLSIGLRMISCRHAMSDTKFLAYLVKLFVEMSSTITDDRSRYTKPGKQLLQEFSHYPGIISGKGLCFSPLQHIINRNQDVFVLERSWKRSHEVDSPNIKKFHQNGNRLRHL